jgi:hypothetical protein
MAEIAFTQYLRPSGRRETVRIDRPDEIAAKAQRILAAGFCFECEVLMDGHVSFTIAGDEDDVEIEVVPNGPDVPAAIDRMINRFSNHLSKATALEKTP